MFLLLLLLIGAVSAKSRAYPLEVQRVLQPTYGFHRKLEIQISLGAVCESCFVNLTQEVTSSWMLDSYELDSLDQPGLILVGPVQLEAPAWKAIPYTLHFSRVVSCPDTCSINLSIPLHLRYHEPAASGQFTAELPQATCRLTVPSSAKSGQQDLQSTNITLPGLQTQGPAGIPDPLVPNLTAAALWFATALLAISLARFHL